MDEKQQKQLKEILKSEFLPLFIGLRNELKEVNEGIIKLYSKEFPTEVKISNQPEPIKSVDVANLPFIQKTEVTNFPEPHKEVEVKNLASNFGYLAKTIRDIIKTFQDTLENRWNDLRLNVFDVNIKNTQPFPKDIKISNLSEIIIPKIDIPSTVKISNFAPADAIPVVLTQRDRKNFYDAFNQMYVANDVNLERLIQAIKNVDVDIGEINVDLDDVEALITATNVLLTTISTIDFATETTLGSVKTAVEAIQVAVESIDIDLDQFKFNGDNLKVEVENFPTSIDVGNFPTTIDIGNLPTTIDVGNFPSGFDVNNFPTDYALETTLGDVKTAVESIDTDIDVALSSRLSEQDFDDKIGEVQTTPTAHTVLARLKDITDALGTLSVNVASDLWQKLAFSGKAFDAFVDSTTVAPSTQTDFILIKNPVNSGVLVRVHEWLLGIDGPAAQRSLYRFYLNPTITANGTAVTVHKHLHSQAQASQVSVFRSPTISARGTFEGIFAVKGESPTLIVGGDMSDFIEAGETVLITVDASTSNVEHLFTVVWAEVDPITGV